MYNKKGLNITKVIPDQNIKQGSFNYDLNLPTLLVSRDD